MITLLTTLAITSVVAYGCYLLVLFLAQDKLLFRPPKPQHLLYEKYTKFHCGITHNNIYLQGWVITGINESSNTIAIYFGGNAEDIAETIPTLKNFPVEKLYAFNYRGYGLSLGKPSQENFYHDALVIYDEINNRHPNKNIMLIGYSLGSAIAGYVAKNKRTDHLILLAPLDSIFRAAQEKFWGLIHKILIRNNFELSQTAKSITCTTLVFVAEKDTTITTHQSLKTYHALKGKKQLISIPEATHNNLLDFKKTFESISCLTKNSQNNYQIDDEAIKRIAIYYAKKLKHPFAEEYFSGVRSITNTDEALEIAKVFWQMTDLASEDHLNNVPVFDNVDIELWAHNLFNKLYGHYEKNGFKEQWKIAEAQCG